MSIGGITALVGVLTAVGLTADLPSRQREFATVSAPVQTLISVGVPFLGAVMTYDLDLQGARRGVLPTVLRAVGLAVGFALFGAIVTAAAVAAFPSHAPQGRWANALVVALGSVLVQVVAQLTGTGFGLLIRRPVLACLATIVFPLAFWVALGELAPQARAWLTPFESAKHLSAGTMTASSWLPFVVMASVWGLGLNLAGYGRLLRSDHHGNEASRFSKATSTSPDVQH